MEGPISAGLAAPEMNPLDLYVVGGEVDVMPSSTESGCRCGVLWHLRNERCMDDGSLRDTLDAISDDPCADCGKPLGKSWTTRYNATTERQERVHHDC